MTDAPVNSAPKPEQILVAVAWPYASGPRHLGHAAGAAGDMGGDAIDSALREIEWMERLSKEIRRPVSFAMLQFDSAPNQWRELVAICEKTRSKGADLLAQFAPRPFGILTGHQTEANQFLNRPAYLEIAHLPLPERVARLKDPAVRARILGPERDDRAGFGSMLDDPNMQKKIFPLGDPPDYEPGPEKSIWAIAQREGRSADEVLYDYMLRTRGASSCCSPSSTTATAIST